MSNYIHIPPPDDVLIASIVEKLTRPARGARRTRTRTSTNTSATVDSPALSESAADSDTPEEAADDGPE